LKEIKEYQTALEETILDRKAGENFSVLSFHCRQRDGEILGEQNDVAILTTLQILC
jgi:hypothetical protein